MIRWKNDYKLIDYVCLLTVVVTLAFHDKTALLIISQMIFWVATFINRTSKGLFLVPKGCGKYLIWYFCFCAFCAISVIWSMNRSTYITIMMSLVQVALLGICIIFYEEDEKKIHKLMIAIMSASVILCLRLVVEVPLDAWGSERVGRYIGYGNVGVTYVLGFSSLIPFFYARIKNNNWYYIMSALFIVFSSLTGTKKGLITFVLGILIILLFETSNIKKILKNMVMLLCVTIIVFIAVMNVDVLYEAVGSRIISAIGQINGEMLDKSTRDRGLLMQYAWQTFLDSPIVGIGIDAFRFYEKNLFNQYGMYAHNNYLELMANLGLVGTVLYYGMIFVATIRTGIFTKKHKKHYSIIAFALLVTLLIGDFVSVSYVQETLQLYIAMALGIDRYHQYCQEEYMGENMYSNSV